MSICFNWYVEKKKYKSPKYETNLVIFAKKLATENFLMIILKLRQKTSYRKNFDNNFKIKKCKCYFRNHKEMILFVKKLTKVVEIFSNKIILFDRFDRS